MKGHEQSYKEKERKKHPRDQKRYSISFIGE